MADLLEERLKIITRYRDRALQLRVIADELTSKTAQQIILETAKHYLETAAALEHSICGTPIKQKRKMDG